MNSSTICSFEEHGYVASDFAAGRSIAAVKSADRKSAIGVPWVVTDSRASDHRCGTGEADNAQFKDWLSLSLS
jgi:hypothetical protein